MKKITKSKDITTKDLTLQKISKLIKDTKEEDLEKIDVIYLQNLIQEIIHGEVKSPCCGDEMYNHSREFMYAKDCLDSEYQETLQILPWKSWKTDKYKNMTFTDIIDFLDEQGGELSMEVADMVFFMSVMFIRVFEMLRLPISDKTKKILYLIKYKENMERIEQSVFKKSRELSEKEKNIMRNIDKILKSK